MARRPVMAGRYHDDDKQQDENAGDDRRDLHPAWRSAVVAGIGGWVGHVSLLGCGAYRFTTSSLSIQCVYIKSRCRGYRHWRRAPYNAAVPKLWNETIE